MSSIDDFAHNEIPAEVARILNRGKVIGVRSPAFLSPIISIIQRFNDGCLYFRVSDEFLKSNVLLGDHLSCQIIEEGYEYVLDGIVGDMQFNYPRELQFIITDINIYKNMRKHRRYNVNFPAEVLLNRIGRKTCSIVHNISVADLNMISKEKFEKNDHIEIDLYVNKESALKFKARVTRVSPGGKYMECGMQITEIDDANRDRLDKIIYQLQIDEGKFVSESLK